MKAKHYLLLPALSLLAAACTGVDYTQREPAPRVDAIDISEVEVTLPEGKGKELVERSCMPCHSLRYIEMQPAMPHKSWEKTVTKMIKMYGAPVRDSVAAAQIVQYLTGMKDRGA